MSVRSVRRHVSVLSAVAALAPSIAHGAPTDGRVRLSLETSVLSYESFTLSSGGTSLSRSQTDFGLGAGGLGVGVGVGLGESFVLGGRALYQSSTESGDGLGADTTTTGVALSATPEYVFSGDALRPFVGATLGYRSIASDSGSLSTSTSLGFVGPTLGLHAFVADSVSIDPSVSALYETGGTSSAGVDLERSGVAVLVGVGLSGWLGGAPAPVGSRPATSGTGPSRDAASAGPSPAATPARAEMKPKAKLHDLTVTLPLGGSSRLLFKADPAGSRSVDVVLIAADTDELRACEVLTADGVSPALTLGPFTEEPIRAGSASLLALRAQIPLASVRAIGRSTDLVTLRGCGQNVELDEADRDVLGRFASVAKIREREWNRFRARRGLDAYGAPIASATTGSAGHEHRKTDRKGG